MPVTKTAKRALRSSKRKEKVNIQARTKLEIAIRTAKKTKKKSDIINAISLTDRVVKNKLIHKNKSARIKSSLSKLLSKGKVVAKKTSKSSGKKK